MAVDLKYGRVTLERSTIGEDEPVVVFRARDVLLPELLRTYRTLCARAGSPDHHLEAVERGLDVVLAWQEAFEHADDVRVPRSDTLGPHTATFGTAAPLGSEPLAARRGGVVPLEAARSALLRALETGTSSLGVIELEALVPLVRLLGVPTGKLEGPTS